MDSRNVEELNFCILFVLPYIICMVPALKIP